MGKLESTSGGQHGDASFTVRHHRAFPSRRRRLWCALRHSTSCSKPYRVLRRHAFSSLPAHACAVRAPWSYGHVPSCPFPGPRMHGSLSARAACTGSSLPRRAWLASQAHSRPCSCFRAGLHSSRACCLLQRTRVPARHLDTFDGALPLTHFHCTTDCGIAPRAQVERMHQRRSSVLRCTAPLAAIVHTSIGTRAMHCGHALWPYAANALTHRLPRKSRMHRSSSVCISYGIRKGGYPPALTGPRCSRGGVSRLTDGSTARCTARAPSGST